jgi:hypothetical protein
MTFCSRVLRAGRDRAWLWALLALLLTAPAAEPANTTLDWTVAREGMPALNGVAGNDSVYVMVGDYGEIYTSEDAVTWARQIPDPAHRNLRGITYDGSRFVAVGDPWAWARIGQNTAAAMVSSDNGSSWDLCDTGLVGVGLAAVASSSTRYVAVGDRGKVLWAETTDCDSWAAGDSGTDQNLTGVAFGGGRFVAVGPNRTVITSPDGASWSAALGVPVDVSGNASLRGVTHTGALFVAAGSDNSGSLLMTSPDGSNWTREVAPSWGYTGVGSRGGLVLATGWGTIAVRDGTGWSAGVLPGDESRDGVRRDGRPLHVDRRHHLDAADARGLAHVGRDHRGRRCPLQHGPKHRAVHGQRGDLDGQLGSGRHPRGQQRWGIRRRLRERSFRHRTVES